MIEVMGAFFDFRVEPGRISAVDKFGETLMQIRISSPGDRERVVEAMTDALEQLQK